MCSRHFPLLLLLLLSSTFVASTIHSQCSSLLRSFPSASLPTWRPGTNCCRGWEGVTCSPSPPRITALDLSDRSISGPIGPSLFDIPSLVSLNLAFNRFYNMPIPSPGFENLTNLTHLNLSYSGFVGQIPLGIASLTNLVSLDLSNAFCYSCLELRNPNFETLVRNLSNLRELYLDGVNISESVNQLSRVLAGAARDISVLSLSWCSLSGPVGFIANFSSLTVLRLASSGLQGLFPTNIFHLKHLREVDLGNNPMLSGYLPEFAHGSRLASLVLSETNFSGNLPNSIGNLKSLRELDLSFCQFSGVIPSSIAYLPQLLRLDLSWNNFSGPIPSVMPARISEIILRCNLLTGPIPLSFGELLHLTVLNLGNNFLSGPVLTSLFTLPLLNELILSQNKISGQIQEFSNASSLLRTVSLSNNMLSGQIPTSVFQLSGLNELYLAWNNFNGTIELDWLRGLKYLGSLDLSYNSLSVQGGDGNSSIPYPTITTLHLASCNLTEVPSFLRYPQQYQMRSIDLSNNRIGGAIPNGIWNVGNLNLSHNLFTYVEGPLPTFSMDSLINLDLHSNLLQGPIPIPPASAVILDYSNNNFSTPIPTNIALYLSYTTFFSLANNSITGEIPPSICNATNLRVLDFSDNLLSGLIPPCLLENNNDLRVLNLRNNQLRLAIPWNISKNCGLRTLDLNGNHLEGKVPPSLTNCDGLEVLELGNNRMVDSFPLWLSNISSLRVLVLRSNEFYGPVGPALGSQGTNYCTFPVLQILDISSNHFDGTLPLDCFKSLKGMMITDLHLNSSILGFRYMKLSPSYYYDAVTITAKGVQYPIVKILNIYTVIDLSNNRFTGDIPKVIGELRSLYILNLSQNALTGQIPMSMENMMQLESLDLSGNQLSGDIPQGLRSLTFLSFLNLSNNNLVGRIPQGSQFSTFANTSYQGNEGLCGLPLSKQCSNDSDADSLPSSSATDSDPTYVIGLALFSGLGYGVGIAVVIVLQNNSVWRGRRRSRVRRGRRHSGVWRGRRHGGGY